MACVRAGCSTRFGVSTGHRYCSPRKEREQGCGVVRRSRDNLARNTRRPVPIPGPRRNRQVLPASRAAGMWTRLRRGGHGRWQPHAGDGMRAAPFLSRPYQRSAHATEPAAVGDSSDLDVRGTSTTNRASPLPATAVARFGDGTSPPRPAVSRQPSPSVRSDASDLQPRRADTACTTGLSGSRR